MKMPLILMSGGGTMLSILRRRHFNALVIDVKQ